MTSEHAVRLVCFPYAGGGAAAFAAWQRLLPDFVDVEAIVLPGRESRLGEPPLTRLEDAVAEVVAPLRHPGGRPVVFFGHSLGAVLAFEVARALRRAHAPLPACLIVSGVRAPHIPDPSPPVHALPEAEFIEELRRLDGSPPGVLDNPELLQLLLPGLRADFQMYDGYRYEADAPLECPIQAFAGRDDADAPVADVEAWRLHTQRWLPPVVLDGGHFFVLRSRTALLRHLAEILGRVAAQCCTTGPISTPSM